MSRILSEPIDSKPSSGEGRRSGLLGPDAEPGLAHAGSSRAARDDWEGYEGPTRPAGGLIVQCRSRRVADRPPLPAQGAGGPPGLLLSDRPPLSPAARALPIPWVQLRDHSKGQDLPHDQPQSSTVRGSPRLGSSLSPRLLPRGDLSKAVQPLASALHPCLLR